MGDLAYGDYQGDYSFTQPNQAYPSVPMAYSTQPVPTSMSAQNVPAAIPCDHCGEMCYIAYRKADHKPYYLCKKPSDGGSCTNDKGFFKWAEDLGKPKQPFQKRQAAGPAPSQPPAQRPAQAPIQRQQHVTPEMMGRVPAPAAPPPGQTDAWFLRLQQHIQQLTQKVDFLTAFITQHLSPEPAFLEGAVDTETATEQNL